MKLPRLFVWLLIAIALLVLIAVVSPPQLPVVLYKLVLLNLAIVLAYWFDRALFPYARPHVFFNLADTTDKQSQYYDAHQLRIHASLATVRRAIIVLAVVLGLTLGL